jgi:hypothetical protein
MSARRAASAVTKNSNAHSDISSVLCAMKARHTGSSVSLRSRRRVCQHNDFLQQLGDGAVRFLSENINHETYMALGSKSGGEIVGEF